MCFAKVIPTVEQICSPKDHRMEDYSVCTSAQLNTDVSERSGVLESLFALEKMWRLQRSLDARIHREGRVTNVCYGLEMLGPVHE